MKPGHHISALSSLFFGRPRLRRVYVRVLNRVDVLIRFSLRCAAGDHLPRWRLYHGGGRVAIGGLEQGANGGNRDLPLAPRGTSRRDGDRITGDLGCIRQILNRSQRRQERVSFSLGLLRCLLFDMAVRGPPGCAARPHRTKARIRDENPQFWSKNRLGTSRAAVWRARTGSAPGRDRGAPRATQRKAQIVRIISYVQVAPEKVEMAAKSNGGITESSRLSRVNRPRPLGLL